MKRLISGIKDLFRGDDFGEYTWEIPDDDSGPDPDGPSAEQVEAWYASVEAEIARRARIDELIESGEAAVRERQYGRHMSDMSELGIAIHAEPPTPS